MSLCEEPALVQTPPPEASAFRALGERVRDLVTKKRVLAVLAVLAGLALLALVAPHAALADRPGVSTKLEELNQGTSIFDGIASGFAAVLRTAANMLLLAANEILKLVSGDNILGNHFGEMFGATAAAKNLPHVLQTIQTECIIPLAAVIVTVMFVVNLANLLNATAKADSTLDGWQMCWVLLCYAFGMLVITNSWDLMVAVYNMVADVIAGISVTSAAFDSEAPIPDDVKDYGVLLMMLIGALFVLVLSIVVVVITQFSVVARGFQVYVYTTVAPVALAFITSETSRSMATGFLKRWLATLAAGVIMVLLLVCMSTLINGTGGIALAITKATTIGGIIEWFGGLLTSLSLYLALAFCMLQSGAWARELMGV